MQALFDGLWQGAFVVAVAAGITMLVPGRHAATRYAVWFVSLFGLLILPLAGQFSLSLPTAVIPDTVVRTTSAASLVAHETSNAGGFWFAAVWAAGMLVCSVRIVLSYLHLNRIMRSAAPAPQIGERVFTSSVLAVPVAAGLWRPAVILPVDLVRTLAAHDLEAVLTHERAHIARNDILGNVLQRVVESLLFFNPWVYVIGRQLVREREAACDDRAVRAGSDPGRYASCLASLGLRGSRIQTSLLTPSAIWPERVLVGRIARLINGEPIQVKTNYAIVGTAITLFTLLGFAFQNPPPGLAATASCSSDVAVLHRAAPDIPESVVKTHPNAEVTLDVTVTAGGHPSDIEIAKVIGNPTEEMLHAAAHAARDTKYKPAIRNCKAVSGGKFTFHVDFGQ